MRMLQMAMFSLTLLLPIVFTCTNTSNPLSVLSLSKLPITYEIGQQWLYKRLFIIVGLRQLTGKSDTIRGYAYSKVTDTITINNLHCYIIEGVDYDIQEDSVFQYHQKWAVYINDTILKVLEYDTGDFGITNGPFKKRVDDRQAYFSPAALRKVIYQKANVSYQAGFKDEVYPLRFPLAINGRWIYRYQDTILAIKEMQRQYVGQEKIAVPAGVFNTYKIDWLLSEYLSGLNNSDMMLGYDWFNENGLIKRFFRSGPSEIYDDYGRLIGTSEQSFDLLEFLGDYSIDPDTLKPSGR